MKRINFMGFVIALLAFSLVHGASADTQVINIKSDSTWKASSSIASTDWFKPEFDDSNWGSSDGRWANNPCSKYCGKMSSCELTCIDWMWFNNSCSNCERYFRKTITLPDDITSGTITMTADNYYWLYVNGNHIGDETRPIGYSLAKTYDITHYLLPGKNVIAIQAHNDDGTEGVALMGEIKYQTSDTQINQLQTQIDTMESQINSLSVDKSRLQSQVDVFQEQVKNLTSSKDELTAQVSQFQIENIGLKNSNTDMGAQLADATSRAETSRVLNIVLILGLVIVLAALIASLFYFSNKLKGRKPRLVEPEKRMPTERMVMPEKESSSLSVEKPVAPAPSFERGRTSTLAGK